MRLALLLVGDRESAEDVVQDVFSRLHGRRPDALSLAYVRVCVLNASRSVLRRRSVAARLTPGRRDDGTPRVLPAPRARSSGGR
ncbi:hypothetical protein [Nonomuraea sp. NPDC050691]|uniref:hypothetical protein n=1 Tax=Nonomuraea sp. NPDC050691 TaxID=3155661 RepID=UPI0033EE8D81